MTPTVNKSVTKDNNSIGSDRNEVDRRLREIGITQPFVTITDGTKRSAVDHTDPANQYPLGEIDGTYGVMPIDSLGFVDIDTDDPPEPVDRLIAENPTFTVKSPHGGEHHYYDIDGKTSNAREQWGEIRAESWYVVGPGSTIDHGHCGDCGYAGESRYRVIDDRPIASIDAGDIDQLADRSTTDAPTTRVDESELGETDLAGDHGDHHIGRRLRKARTSWDQAEQFRQLWNGEYKQAGFTTDDGDADRSTAEFRFSEMLGWWFDDDTGTVNQCVDRSCAETSNTADGQVRKFIDPEAPDGYRQATISAACNHETCYDPGAIRTGPNPDRVTYMMSDRRPEVSYVTKNGVMDALMDLGAAKKSELVEHPAVDRERSQVVEALRQYRQDDLVTCVKGAVDRRERYYHLAGIESIIPDQKRRLMDLDSPVSV